MYDLIIRNSNYENLNYVGDKEIADNISEYANILVVGAGGLGCEIMKNLALSNIKKISIVDMDKIELSNLNRQFLFRQKDIGRYKSEVVAEFIQKKYPEIKVNYYTKKVQDFSISFMKQFNAIIGGLDNDVARSDLSKLVHDMVEYDNEGNIKPESLVPYIDGGTEGFRGQSKVIIPFQGSCLECQRDMIAPRKTVPNCTITERPRTPEHCILYIIRLQWSKAFPGKDYDADKFEDVDWICKEAIKRGEEFGIHGIDYKLTLGVIKNVIPAIASTNAIIAAETVFEALKCLSGCVKKLNNYFSYGGHEGIYTDTYKIELKERCIVCQKPEVFKPKENYTLKDFIEEFTEKFKLIKPSIMYKDDYIYYLGNTSDSSNIEENLQLKLIDLFEKKLVKEKPFKLRLINGDIEKICYDVLIILN